VIGSAWEEDMNLLISLDSVQTGLAVDHSAACN